MQSPSWEASSDSQSRNSPPFMGPEVLLPPPIAVLSQNFPPYFPKTHSSIILPFTPRPSLQFFRPQLCMHFSSFPSFCIPRPSNHPWFDHPSNVWWRVRIKAPHYAVFSSLLPLPPLRPKYCHRYPLPRTPWVYVRPLAWEVKFHTRTKQQVKL